MLVTELVAENCVQYFKTMGRIFLEHMGGSRLFSCARCDTNLTNRAELISTRFTGATDRVMLTGRHMVRDVSCKFCECKLGWMYEFATEDNQRYKEGNPNKNGKRHQ
ncbi:hypothetical protein Trydic_g20855 [Trypoxylus dichotomus]